MTAPEGSLIAAPGGEDGDDGEDDCLDGLQDPVLGRRSVVVVRTEMMCDFDVCVSTFGHAEAFLDTG